MDYLRFLHITFLVMITVSPIWATTFIQKLFKKPGPGEIIIGRRGVTLTAALMDCGESCSDDFECTAYQYRETGPGNCILIYANSTENDGHTFRSDAGFSIFKKDLCLPNPCFHGSCFEQGDSYRCQCDPGYYGDNCEERNECHSNPCLHGNCTDGNEAYSCECEAGFLGDNCADEDDCYHDNACVNNSTCVDRPVELPEIWIPPVNWTGPDLFLYRSFDNLNYMTLMEGTLQQNFEALVPGRVNRALRLNADLKQWVDLGVHREVCLTWPALCTDGGAVSFWLNITTGNPFTGGILSCYDTGRLGLSIAAGGRHIRYTVDFSGSMFHAAVRDFPTGWTHVVMNYIVGGGLQIIYDGTLRLHANTLATRLTVPRCAGRLVVGRRITDVDGQYQSLEIDELLIYNQKLSL